MNKTRIKRIHVKITDSISMNNYKELLNLYDEFVCDKAYICWHKELITIDYKGYRIFLPFIKKVKVPKLDGCDKQ